MTDTIRLAELTGAIARAADVGIGFPPETSLRLCLVAAALARTVGLSDEETRDVYHAALLRHAGCTASAHEETRMAGDELELRRTIAMGDAGSPGDMLPRPVRGLVRHLDLKTKGKVAAIRYFEALASSVDRKAFEQRDFATTGNHVYATVRLVQHIRATGKTLEQPEVVHHFTLRKWQGRGGVA